MSSIEVIHVRRQPAPLPPAARRRRSSGGGPPEEVLVHTGVPPPFCRPLPSQDPRPTRSRQERGATVALASDCLFILHFRFYWSRGHWPWNREYHTATLFCLPLCTYHPCRPRLPSCMRLSGLALGCFSPRRSVSHSGMRVPTGSSAVMFSRSSPAPRVPLLRAVRP